MPDPLQKIRKVIRDSIDSTPEKVSFFFRTGVGDYAQHDQFIGITVPTLRKIAKNFISSSLEDVSLLIHSPLNEERLLALLILVSQYQKGKADDQKVIYQFYLDHLSHINNWNLVDASAHPILGHYLWDKDRSRLSELAASDSLWERRIAMVATWYFIRKSELDWTFKIAKQLQKDPHDLIHKAVGWMLREAGKKDEAALISFLSNNVHQMPKTMVRYAMERLSKEQKMAIMTSVSS